MKRCSLLFVCALLWSWSCKKEQKHTPMALPAESNKFDTTYILSVVPTAEPHNVLLEYMTGPMCSNVPAADEQIRVIDSSHPGRINVIANYDSGCLLAGPPPGASHDFRTPDRLNFATHIFNSIHTLPAAGIDRLYLSNDTLTFGTHYLTAKRFWDTLVASHINDAGGINLNIASNYNATTQTDSVTLKMTFTSATSDRQNFTIAIVEDSIIDIQEFPAYYDSNYSFNSILRTTATGDTYGDTLLPSLPLKEAGRVYQVAYKIPINTAWNPAHCRIIAFVHGYSGINYKKVYQSKQARVIP